MQTRESLLSFLCSFAATEKNFCSCIKPRHSVTVINTIIKKSSFIVLLCFQQSFYKECIKEE